MVANTGSTMLTLPVPTVHQKKTYVDNDLFSPRSLKFNTGVEAGTYSIMKTTGSLHMHK